MAGGELLSELVRAHFADESTRFDTILNQVIAAEARAGHTQVAHRLRELRDAGAAPHVDPDRRLSRAIPLARTTKPLGEVVEIGYSDVHLRDLILDPTLMGRLETLIVEQRKRVLLEEHGLKPRRKVLLHGPPGTGKTMTAYALAGELGLPVARVRLEVLFSRYLGETASTLAEIFAEAGRLRAVYLFDEFDALGSQRTETGDVGEMRRIVSTFLQLLDADKSESIFVAATNVASHLDGALFRRFDDVLEYERPTEASREILLSRGLRASRFSKAAVSRLAALAADLSLADMAAAIDEARKAAVLDGRSSAMESEIRSALINKSPRKF